MEYRTYFGHNYVTPYRDSNHIFGSSVNWLLNQHRRALSISAQLYSRLPGCLCCYVVFDTFFHAFQYLRTPPVHPPLTINFATSRFTNKAQIKKYRYTHIDQKEKPWNTIKKLIHMVNLWPLNLNLNFPLP
jgi:hypothetical protein